MSENVPHRRQSSRRGYGCAESGSREGKRRARARKLGWRPESSPDPARRTSLEQHPAVRKCNNHVSLSQASRCAAPGNGDLRDASGGQCTAAARQRAAPAEWLRPSADRGPEIHDCLRVFRDARLRRAVECKRPELLRASRGVGRRLNLEHPREHALDVAVEDRVTLAMREREDRARRRPADSWECHQLVQRLGQAAAMASDDFLRGAPKVSRPCVVAEARP